MSGQEYPSPNSFKSFLQISIIVSIVIILTTCSSVGSVIVRTRIGQIRGLKLTTPKGTTYLSFRGIPYAQPPVKSLRFKAPVPISPWEGVFNGTDDGPVCPQLHIATNQVIGDENCLHVNVYSSDLDVLKPVIVFIHGGGFNTGAAASLIYGPDFIVDENIVLITIQYRLGVLGFLSTEDRVTPGNWGLLDQIEALNWVKSNVASFGGDPDKITVMGEGAGAASVSLLTLTTRARGLFGNMILLGGTALNPQYLQKNPLESAKELGSRLQCNSYKDFQQLVDCIRASSTENLVKEVNQMFHFFNFPRWFAPCIDNVLFDKTPEEIFQSGKFTKVPVLMGLAAHEAAFYYPLTLNSFNDGKYDGNFIDQRLPRLLPVISEFQSKLFPTSRALKKRYFTNINIDNEDEFRPRYIELLNDLLFTRFFSQYGNLLSEKNIPVYYFLLEYQGSNSIMQSLGDTEVKSIAHGDILQYLFSQILGEDRELPADDEAFARKTLIPLIVNFVKYSNPTPTNALGASWPKFTQEEPTVLSVGRELKLRPKFRTGILRYWAEELPEIVSPKKRADEL
ncbi:unnamed protein product [Allacma fusca]|uniref:Carboxylesterase type B domain-containing protein n=1 Tax=Allacma fusca TaxID=39272 RepID=A0A8J2PHL1_9HEXA|nr:unnamed protein product [Allacma fusca]